MMGPQAAPNPGLASRALTALLLASLLCASAPARADVSAADKAAAEALFEHGKQLMKDARYPEACAKFQESQRIDPGIGTMLYLADCFEKNGQTASAWAEFLDAAAAAKAAAQPDREKKAKDRALALEPKLNRLSITVAVGAESAGLEVKRDGVLVSKALWGTAVPLDPGEHTIEATAPGKKPWSKKVKLDPALLAPVAVEIPSLEALPPSVEPPKPEPPKVEPPKVEPPKTEPPKSGPPKAPRDVGPIVSTRDTMPSVRIAGGALVGVGIGSAAVGGILGAVTLLKKSSAGLNCRSNGVCGPDGTNDINGARSLATPTNVMLGVGGGLFLAGVIILVATKPVGPDSAPVMMVTPVIGGGMGGLAAGGTF
jgi:serine/threonine-protein kinase